MTPGGVAAAINASGLWASYGDACEVLGYGPRGWRACAKQNWVLNVRLARADGTTNHEDPTRGQEWVEGHPAEVLVDGILGYGVSSGGPHHHEGRMPREKRLSAREVLMLAGRVRPNWELPHRIDEQCFKLECWLEAAPAGTPHRDRVEAAYEASRALLRRLQSDRAANPAV